MCLKGVSEDRQSQEGGKERLLVSSYAQQGGGEVKAKLIKTNVKLSFRGRRGSCGGRGHGKDQTILQ